ncbi:MAG: MalY/PatB family protein [Bacillota bacterium]
MYDFDKMIERQGTASVKWDKLEEIFDQDDIIPLWVADSDWSTAPEVIAAVKKRVEHGVFGYTFPEEEYKEAVVEWYKKRYDWEIETDWVVFTSGVVPAINLSLLAFTSPGDGVIVQPPVYYPFFSAVEKNNAQLIENQLIEPTGLNSKTSKYKIDFADLEAKLKSELKPKVLLFCHPHNPVGRVWQEEELLQLLDLVERYQMLVVSDEIHADFVFAGRHRPLASLRPELKDQIITLSAPSKTFNLAGLATAYAVIPNPGVRKAFQDAADGLQPAFNALGLTALKAAYEEGEAWLEAQNEYLQANLRYARTEIDGIPGIDWVESEGTYLLWLDFSRTGLTDKELEDLLYQKARVGLEPGYWFGNGGAGFFRLNLAAPRARLGEAFVRLKDVMAERFAEVEETK